MSLVMDDVEARRGLAKGHEFGDGVMRIIRRRLAVDPPSHLGNNAAAVSTSRRIRLMPSLTHESLPPRRRVQLRIRQLMGWQEEGWEQRGNEFHGHYRVGNRHWQGMAVSPPTRQLDGQYDFYAKDPPEGIISHNHRACWHRIQQLGPGWYWIHHNPPPPADLLSGIRNIEMTIRECI